MSSLSFLLLTSVSIVVGSLFNIHTLIGQTPFENPLLTHVPSTISTGTVGVKRYQVKQKSFVMNEHLNFVVINAYRLPPFFRDIEQYSMRKSLRSPYSSST